MKKSFLLYHDMKTSIDGVKLSQKQKGDLFDAIFCYHNNCEMPELDPLTNAAWAFLKTTFDRDIDEYKRVSGLRKEAGKKGGKQKVANASKRKQKVAKGSKASKSYLSVSVSESVSESEKKEEERVKNSLVEDSVEFRLARYLFNCIRLNKPDFKQPNLQQWEQQVDYMIRLDKRDPDQIKEVIKWCQEDNTPNESGFCWANTILSVVKLRKQFDQLSIRMNNKTEDTGDWRWE